MASSRVPLGAPLLRHCLRDPLYGLVTLLFWACTLFGTKLTSLPILCILKLHVPGWSHWRGGGRGSPPPPPPCQHNIIVLYCQHCLFNTASLLHCYRPLYILSVSLEKHKVRVCMYLFLGIGSLGQTG